jgi:hypothetical protein
MRSKQIVWIAAGIVAVGLLAALAMLLLLPSRQGLGPLPAQAMVFPRDAGLLVGLDVKRLSSSPLFATLAARVPGLADLERTTGLDPARDLDRVFVAGRSSSQGAYQLLVLAQGRFTAQALSETLEKKGARPLELEGSRGFEVAAGQTALTLFFLDDHTLLAGPREAVEPALSARAAGTRPLLESRGLRLVLERVTPGASAWIVAGASLLAGLPGRLPSLATGMPGMELPALQGLAVSGDLEPVISARVVAVAADEAGAQRLADAARALSTLLTLRPELRELGSAISVTTEAEEVQLSLRLPPESLAKLGVAPKSS